MRALMGVAVALGVAFSAGARAQDCKDGAVYRTVAESPAEDRIVRLFIAVDDAAKPALLRWYGAGEALAEHRGTLRCVAGPAGCSFKAAHGAARAMTVLPGSFMASGRETVVIGGLGADFPDGGAPGTPHIHPLKGKQVPPELVAVNGIFQFERCISLGDNFR